MNGRSAKSKASAQSGRAGKSEKVVAFRPDLALEKEIEDLSNRAGLTKTQLLERAVRYCVPRWMNGELPIINLSEK